MKLSTEIPFLKGKADIAVFGSQASRIMESAGIEAAAEFMPGLR